MMTQQPALIVVGSRFRRLSIVAALAAALTVTNVLAQPPVVAGSAVSVNSAEALDQLVGRIALYPDELIAIVLPAATNPLQLVQADRFLDKRKTDPKLPIDDKWDDPVKSLLNYPEILKHMSNDLDWTSALGEAVVKDQGAVLDAIQTFRRKTHAVGNLKSDEKQVIVVEKEVITIVPADPQVIYVPQYNPSTVVVSGAYSSYGYYPAPYPVYSYPYPPGAALATGLIWGAAIGAAWSGNHYATHYGGYGGSANINVNRNINRSVSVSQLPARGGSASTQWKPGRQPGQVSNTVGRMPSGRVGDARPGGTSALGPRPSTPPSGSGAFHANTSGRQAQLDSSRGAASRNAMSGASHRQAPAASARQAPTGARNAGGGGTRGGGARGGGGGRGGAHR